MNWFYVENRQRQGPFTDTEFDRLVRENKVLPSTLVWNEEMENWRLWREIRSEHGYDVEPPPLTAAFLEKAAQETAPEGPAWEHRHALGIRASVVETMKQVLGSTDRTFSHMKRTGGLGVPLLYALLAGGVGKYIEFIFNFILIRMGWVAVKGEVQGMMGSNANILLMVIFTPIYVIGCVYITSALVHLTLSMFGGARTAFETTFRVVAYSYGATAVFLLIPALGGVLSIVWNAIVLVIGLSKAHGISGGKAFVSLLPVILFAFCVLAVLVGARML